MSGRYYAAGVEEALHLLSGGGCYRPGCGEPTIRFEGDLPKKNVVVAHIHAFEDKGPRAIPTMPMPERNKFHNLILLCIPCHDIVDHDVTKYPASLLKKWKADRESKPKGSLSGLRNLDRDSLERMLNNAMTGLHQDMTEVAAMFPELARLLKDVIGHVPRLDPESISMLHEAAIKLGGLEDHAPMLAAAARKLDLPDHASVLAMAARRLDLPDYAPLLIQAAKMLSSLPDTVNQLHAATRNLPDLQHQARALDAAVERYDQKISELNSATKSAAGMVREAREMPSQNLSVRVSDWYWKALLFGWAGWVVVILIAVLYAANNGS